MKKLIFMFFTMLLTIGLVACGEKEESQTNSEVEEQSEEQAQTEETEAKEEEAETAGVYFKDNEAKLNDLIIKITETKVIQPGEPGNEYGEKPVFAIWYETTNLTDKEIDPSTAWMAVFTAIQDNDPNAVNELEVGMLPDESHLDTQLEVIKKDGTVENSIAYELDDLETPVTLVATQGLAGKELGRAEYEIK